MQRRLTPLSTLIALLIAAGTLAGLYGMALRFRVERENRRVELGLEFQEISSLAQFSGESTLATLQQFHQRDIDAVIITEDTISSLETTGAVRMNTVATADGSCTVVKVVDPIVEVRILKALQLRGIPLKTGDTPSDLRKAGHTYFISTPQVPAFHTPVSYANMRTLGIGLSPRAVELAHAAHMDVVARVGNYPGVDVASAQRVLDQLHREGVSLVIFSGQDVLGYRGVEKQVAALMLPNSQGVSPTGVMYGEVEFGKQHGNSTLAAALKGAYIRVHSIQAAEMGDMTEPAMVERFGLAARERNIRFCYVRLLTQAGDNTLQENLQYVSRVAARIAHGNTWDGGAMAFGTARPFHRVGEPAIVRALIGLSIAAGVVWLITIIFPISTGVGFGILAVLVLFCAGLSIAGDEGRKLAALLAGITFPCIACLRALPKKGDTSPSKSTVSSLLFAYKTLATACATTVLGIIAVDGLLASRIFVVRAEQFMGIKAQHAVPILILIVFILAGGPAVVGENLKLFCIRAYHRLRTVIMEPALYWQLLLMMLGLAAIAIVLARSGNDSSVAVSPLEMKARALLDHVLPVRPRTKEFLVGHPAWVLALALHKKGRTKLAVPVFIVAALGQVSLLNTFCHIHTPLIIAAWRGGLGILIGAVLGTCCFMIVELIASRLLAANPDADAGQPV